MVRSRQIFPSLDAGKQAKASAEIAPLRSSTAFIAICCGLGLLISVLAAMRYGLDLAAF